MRTASQQVFFIAVNLHGL